MDSKTPICEHTGQPMVCIFCKHGEEHRDCYPWVNSPKSMEFWASKTPEERDRWNKEKAINNQLLPCPFCGEKAHCYIISHHGEQFARIGCINTGCRGNEKSALLPLKHVEVDIKAWNRRPKKKRLGKETT